MPGWRLLRRIADCPFSLEGEDAGLREVAEGLYAGAGVDSAPEGLRFSLGRRATDLVLEREGRALVRAAGQAVFFARAEWALTRALMQALQGYLQVHAGAVALGDRAVLLCGDPGAGKTSLVIALARRGGAPLTDEVALLDERLALTAFARDLRVHPGTERLFPDLGEAIWWKRSGSARFLSPAALGALPAHPVPVSLLVFPVFKEGAPARLSPLGQAGAARRLIEQCFNLERWGGRGLEMLGGLVEECPARMLEFGEARQAAGLLLSEIES